MAESLKEVVYSKNVVEFVTVANEYCSFVERSAEFETNIFIERSLKLLPLLYIKSQLLPELEQFNEEPNEKFVTEFDWQFIRNGIEVILSDKDTYVDNFDTELNETPEPVNYSISENFADIYQDLKDFLEIYKLGDEELSNDAIIEVSDNFKQYWGFRLVNSMRMLHHFFYLERNEVIRDNAKNQLPRDTDKWFISKAQNRFRADE